MVNKGDASCQGKTEWKNCCEGGPDPAELGRHYIDISGHWFSQLLLQVRLTVIVCDDSSVALASASRKSQAQNWVP